MAVVRHKEAIHSGHFMVSEFEAEAQDEDDIAVVPPPEEGSNIPELMTADDVPEVNGGQQQALPARVARLKEPSLSMFAIRQLRESRRAQSIIDISLNKLFQSMSIAYRQKLTSPKWNRFRGLKLRWKDKIRLNNVIWRCWHMQFVKGQRRLLCAFANPLDIDYHNRTEGSTVLEGKYWKRKLDAIKNEYQRWRRFYCETNAGGAIDHESDEDRNGGRDTEWEALFIRSPFQFMEGSKDDVELESMLTDESLMLDIIYNASNSNGMGGSSSFTGSDPFFTGNMMSSAYGNGTGNIMSSSCLGASVPFPNPKDMYYKNTMNADFIQPGLGPLQPNLEDFSFECNIIESLFQQRSMQNTLPTIQEANEPILTNGSNGSMKDKSKLAVLTDVQMMQPSSPQNQVLNTFNNQGQQQQEDVLRFNDAMDQSGYLGNVNMMSKTSPANLSVNSTIKQQQQQINQQQHLTQQQFVRLVENSDQQQPPPVRGQTRYLLSPPGYPDPKVMSAQPVVLSVERQINPTDLFPTQQQQQQQPTMPSFYQHSDTSALNHHKMRSPKHRVLQQREYMSAHAAVTTASANPVAGNYANPGGHSVHHPHLHQQRTAPYTIPSVSAGIPASQGQQDLNPTSELRQLLKSATPASGATVAIPTSTAVKPEFSVATDLSVNTNRYGAFSSPASHALTSSIPPPLSSDLPQSLATSGLTDDLGGLQRPRQNFRGLTHTTQYQEHRRSLHINAEQNRRHSIKHGFETLRSLVPALSSAPSSMKTSKAALLMKGGDYLQQLKSDRDNLVEQAANLRRRIEVLNLEVGEMLAMLPSGGSVSSLSGCRKKRQPDEEEKLRIFFENHVRCCTEINWKYYIFSCLMKPLFDTFIDSVCGSNVDEMARSAINWLDGHCGPAQLRTSGLATLRDLSLRTEILSNPQQLPQEALAAVHNVKFEPST